MKNPEEFAEFVRIVIRKFQNGDLAAHRMVNAILFNTGEALKSDWYSESFDYDDEKCDDSACEDHDIN